MVKRRHHHIEERIFSYLQVIHGHAHGRRRVRRGRTRQILRSGLASQTSGMAEQGLDSASSVHHGGVQKSLIEEREFVVPDLSQKIL